MGLVCVKRYGEVSTAQVDRSVLDAAGIPAFVFDHEIASLKWFLITALGGVRLMVPRQRAADAYSLLNLPAVELVDADPIDICSGCASEDVARLYSWWSVAATSAALMLGLGVPIAFGRARRRCGACGHPWRIKDDV